MLSHPYMAHTILPAGSHMWATSLGKLRHKGIHLHAHDKAALKEELPRFLSSTLCHSTAAKKLNIYPAPKKQQVNFSNFQMPTIQTSATLSSPCGLHSFASVPEGALCLRPRLLHSFLVHIQKCPLE